MRQIETRIPQEDFFHLAELPAATALPLAPLGAQAIREIRYAARPIARPITSRVILPKILGKSSSTQCAQGDLEERDGDEHLSDGISIEDLPSGGIQLVALRPCLQGDHRHDSLQLVTRKRITRALQMIRECPARKRSSKPGALTAQFAGTANPRSIIEIGLEVSPSRFAQVFRRVVGLTPTEFRSSL
jgi:hypothetical protein